MMHIVFGQWKMKTNNLSRDQEGMKLLSCLKRCPAETRLALCLGENFAMSIK